MIKIPLYPRLWLEWLYLSHLVIIIWQFHRIQFVSCVLSTAGNYAFDLPFMTHILHYLIHCLLRPVTLTQRPFHLPTINCPLFIWDLFTSIKKINCFVFEILPYSISLHILDPWCPTFHYRVDSFFLWLPTILLLLIVHLSTRFEENLKHPHEDIVFAR